MRARKVSTGSRRHGGMGGARALGAALVCVIGIVALGSCYQSSPVAPELPPPRPTTTTTTTTTSTTSTLPGATTTTTSTTSGLVDYASQVHPIWGDQGCTASGCHAGGPAPDLSGSPTDSCSGLRSQDGANSNLIITGGGASGAEILTKPQPGTVSHFGGDFNCFNGAGRRCYDTVLAWLQQGANGPGGTTCGG